MTVYATTDTKKGRTGIAPTYLQTTLRFIYGWKITGRFAPWTFRPFTGRFALGRFAPWTFRHQDVSPPGRFAPVRFATWTFRPRLWTFRHRLLFYVFVVF